MEVFTKSNVFDRLVYGTTCFRVACKQVRSAPQSEAHGREKEPISKITSLLLEEFVSQAGNTHTHTHAHTHTHTHTHVLA